MDRGDHRDHASDFLVRGDGLVPRTRGLSADVEDVGALLDHAPGLDDGGLTTAASTESPPRPATVPSRPSPENESGVTFTIPIT